MFILYTTLGCHLCEQAQHIIRQECTIELAVTLVDIAEDESLMEAYGIRIPVLKHTESSAEISWPFSAEELQQWASSLVGSK